MINTAQRVRLTENQLRQELGQIEAAKKNPAGFGVLYEKYYRQIFLFVFKRTGNEEVAGDVVSQVFLKAMLNLKKYQYKGVPFSAWLYRIASNEVNQHFRNKKGERTISMEKSSIDHLMGMAENSGEQGGFFDSDEDFSEMYQEVMLETLQEMKEEEIQIIELRFFEKRPFKEVSFIMGITENNAKVKVYRILERLRKRLRKKLGGSYEA